MQMVDDNAMQMHKRIRRLRHRVGDPVDRGTNPVVTFNCAVIIFPLCITNSITKDQFLSYNAYIVCEVKDSLSQ